VAKGNPPVEVAPSAPSLRDATLLLIEDDDDMLSVVEDCFEDAGLRVLTASTAEEARAVMRERGGEVHIVLTDVLLPDTSGPELIEELRTARPDLAVILVSGFGVHHPSVRGVLAQPRTLFLQKPFDIDEAVERIAALLATRPV
jgi:two-component system, cell cycle sensor histidine kinase and response regulator CckA